MPRNQRRAKRYNNLKRRIEFQYRNKKIWKRRIIDEETLAAIGRDYNLSRERIRQIVFREEMARLRMKIESEITIPDCMKADKLKAGYLYKVKARNGNFGIWLGIENRAFAVSRHKWGTNYIDEEYHYDLDKYYGTVIPLEQIEVSPFNMDDIVLYREKSKEILEYLNRFEKKKRKEKWTQTKIKY